MGVSESFHFHCTDEQGEWVVRFDGPGIDVPSEHPRADVALRGSASDLLLFLWGRKSPGTIEVMGDASLLERWPELLPAI
jgi:predicted lipid carrier protein YhbT